jgi:site-specific DNA-cytosine methylase
LSDKAIAKIKRHNNTSLDNDLSNCIHAGYYKQGGRDQQYIYNQAIRRLTPIELKEDFRSVNAVNKKYPMFGRYNKTPNISSCLNSVDLMGVQYNSRIRRLTPIECERLQGFPDNFTEGVSDTQRYKQMGNTITVNVIQAILKNLKTN